MEKIVLVLDCGATNIRTIAIDENGILLAKSSRANATRSDPYYPEYKIWDLEEIWGKFVETTTEVVSQINKQNIAGITVTTFGVDGAPVDSKGEMLYPVISWACQRTTPIMENIAKYIPYEELYQINGVNNFSFNTINKLLWFKENKPEVLDKSKYFVFISNLIIQKLCGEFVSDVSMLGTSMLTNIHQRKLSDEILDKIGIPASIFPKAVEAGTLVGKTNKTSSNILGIPEGISVISCGHDTQFAVFGSGAKINQPVLSSGTWEILMARTENVNPNDFAREHEVTTEFDAQKGLYTSGIQWLGSGVLEWIKKQFYSKEMANRTSDDIYKLMIDEALRCKDTDVKVNIEFLNNNGGISGLGMHTKREEIYFASLSALSSKTKTVLDILEQTGNFRADSIILVGGGTKNNLWNQIRANSCNLPIDVLEFDETTVLGAAFFTLAGAGIYTSAEEARNSVKLTYNTVYPHKQ